MKENKLILYSNGLEGIARLLLVAVMTGHNLLPSNVNRISMSNTDTGRECWEEGLSSALEHRLCFCQALTRTRLRYLGASQYKVLDEVSK